MPNWIENLITLRGEAGDAERFCAAASGEKCPYGWRDEGFCVHRLVRLVAKPDQEEQELLALPRVGYVEPFDHELRRFVVESAWRPLIPLIARVSTQFPDLVFDYECCDPCAWNGQRIDYYGVQFLDGDPRLMRCEIRVVHGNEFHHHAEFEIASLEDLMLLAGNPSLPHGDSRMAEASERYPLAFEQI